MIINASFLNEKYSLKNFDMLHKTSIIHIKIKSETDFALHQKKSQIHGAY